MQKKESTSFFNRFSNVVSKATGKPGAFILATLVIILWAVASPIFGFSDTWLLVINTGTTIITFLMVFVIQHSQNKDTIAIPLKLNELIAVSCDASNRLVAIEDPTDGELDIIKKFYTNLSKSSKNSEDVFTIHSLDEAYKNTSEKVKRDGAITKSKK